MYASQFGAAAYADVGRSTKVAASSPHELILLLYAGALQALGNAKHHIDNKDIVNKAKNIAKAVDIIHQGLLASLDMSSGGEVAQNLQWLYGYMSRRLVLANLNNDVAIIDEVRGLLTQLQSAWQAIAEQPAVRTATATPALGGRYA